jgi:hypothetical protein
MRVTRCWVVVATVAWLLGSVAIADKLTGATYTGSRPYLSARGNAGAKWRPASWVALTTRTRIEGGRQAIVIGADVGEFRQLRLFNNVGSSRIDHVVVELDGGAVQKYAVNKTLTSEAPITIDLDGGYRRIKRVVVHGSTAPDSAYQLLAK